MQNHDLSPLVQLAVSRPSILHHLKKMGILNEVITRLGIQVEQDDIEFLGSFELEDDAEVYHGIYRDMQINIDAVTGRASQQPLREMATRRAAGA